MTKAEKNTWEKFLKEYKLSIEHSEPLEGFIERMSDDGYSVNYQKIDNRLILEQCREIVDYFNKKCNAVYDISKLPNKISLPIEKQLKNGHTPQTCKRVILMLSDRWSGSQMEVSLRIDVVFNDIRFPHYLAQLPKLPPNRTTPPANNQVPAAAPPPAPIIKPIPRDVTPENQCDLMRELLAELYVFNEPTRPLIALQMLTSFVWDHFIKAHLMTAEMINPLNEKAATFALQKLKSLTDNESILDEKTALDRYRKYYILKKIFFQHSLMEWQNLILPSQFQPVK